ncbi:MAG: polysaccharide deacetylase family protein [Paenibacillaceae bacterium]|nr:polysaccharide deacetylase family protein [Paenibacillaceae bacterium]
MNSTFVSLTKQGAALLTVAALLAACGSTPAGSGGTSSAPASAAVSASLAPSASATPTPAGSPSAAVSIAPSASAASPTPSPSPAAKLYRLNKNYDVVPIDPNGNKKVVLLTFDDGPKDKTMVDSLLGTLSKHKAKAIFFVLGSKVKQNPDLLKQIYASGHTIGNHTWSHSQLNKLSDAQGDEEFDSTQRIIRETIGITPVFFRPPNGISTDHLNERYPKEHVLRMNWSNGSLDWADNQHKPAGVIQSVLDQLHAGSNILMHELAWTAEALDELLTKLEALGYGYVDPATIETP